MKKKLNIEGITNELAGGSAFFPSYQKSDSPTATQPNTAVTLNVTPDVNKPPAHTPSLPVQKEQDSGKPEITKTGIHENPKTGNTENQKSGFPENQNTGKPEITEPHLSDYIKPEKYSTQLRPGLKQKLAVYATLNQMKDYEVLEAALDEFFEKHK